MKLFICSYCGSERKSKKSLIGHETFCKSNPNHKVQSTEAARQKALTSTTDCKWCGKKFRKSGINNHTTSCKKNPKNAALYKSCPVCKKKFYSKSTTCSYSCSNVHFRHSRPGGLRHVDDNMLAERGDYRSLCFRYHDKKCVICGEDKIVAVHHINENHNDNRIENLIPLCPTHHQYCHSNYKNLVEKQIEEYITNWISDIGDEEAGSSAAFGAQRAGFDSRVSDQN
jgi:hypothetical protein